jgi:tetratricopeptide (TPR) repeat protein
MRISLTSPVRKAAFLGVTAILSVIFLALSAQSFAEWWVARDGTIESVELASRIQPLNASHHQLLGSVFLHLDHSRAVQELQRATEINPYSAHTWLLLADAYSVQQNSRKQTEAVLTALKIAPRDLTAQWRGANLLLVQGETEAGLKLLREAVASDPGRAGAAIQIAYNLSDEKVPAAMSAIPATASARLQLMRWLIERKHASEADQVWPAVISAGTPFVATDALFYVNDLLDRREVEKASAAWAELAGRDKKIQRRLEAGNLVVNGDFEENLLNGGFAWRYKLSDGVRTTIDTSTFHAGSRSLALQLDGNTLPDAGVFQLVPVQPGATYSLSAYLHAEELESANGVRVLATNAYSSQVLMTSEEAIGSFPWREVTGEFAAGPDTKLVRIGFGRSPDAGLLRGKIWVDDLRIEKRSR